MRTNKNKEFDRVERLRRRAEFLRQRVPKLGTANSQSYDAGELSALDWAIPLLEDHLVNKTIKAMSPEARAAFNFMSRED